MAATGFGTYLGIPLLRKAWRQGLSAEEARKILEDAHRVLLYRDGRTLNKFQIAKVTADGVNISEPYSLKTDWEYRRFVDPDDTAM